MHTVRMSVGFYKHQAFIHVLFFPVFVIQCLFDFLVLVSKEHDLKDQGAYYPLFIGLSKFINTPFSFKTYCKK